MEYRVGDIVLGRAGREKGRFLVVVKVETDVLYLADGKERKLTSPKKKNIKHVSKTTLSLQVDDTTTDKRLRTRLNELNRNSTDTKVD